MLRAFTAWLPAVLLVACTTLPAPPQAPAVVPASAWTLVGRIGIQTQAESLSGNLRWQHRSDSDDLLLTSPLGQGVARIARDAGGVTLEVPGRPAQRAPDAESLTQEALGYALPVAGLAWWVQALPDPARPFDTAHDAEGRLERLQQDGWTIDYARYDGARPKKLILTRTGLEIRLVADTWHIE